MRKVAWLRPLATALKRYNGGRVLVFVMGAFAEMSEDVSPHTTTTWRGPTSRTTTTMPSTLWACMYRQRIQKACGHTAHRSWARLLLNRARDLIIHGLVHLGANGAAMPTDEDDQDGHFFFNHPERGGYSAA